MKVNGTTQKEAGLARTPEAQFLQGLLDYTREMKRSRRREIALVAARWEGIISFRIAVTLQERERKRIAQS